MPVDLLRQTRDYFKAQGIPEVDATILLEHILQTPRANVQMTLLKMSPDEISEVDQQLRRLVLRRQNGEPVQYITGLAPFRYIELQVGPGVLIPRPETESLVGLILNHIKGLSTQKQKSLKVIDLGSGSGCIAISLAREVLGLEVTAVENSPDALVWLKRNVDSLAPDVRIIYSDVHSAAKGEQFDVVVANPPYIPNGELLPSEVRKEPSVALFGGGPDGLAIPGAFIEAATRLLKPGGFLAMEHHETQGSAIGQLLEPYYSDITLVPDLTGRPRFTTARKISER